MTLSFVEIDEQRLELLSARAVDGGASGISY